jgi:hypothetical protein
MDSPGKFSETLSQKQTKIKSAGDMAQMVEPRMFEALDSFPSTAKRRHMLTTTTSSKPTLFF